MNQADRAKRARLLVDILLPTCALVLGAFYALMFQRDNAAPTVDISGFQAGDAKGFRYRMEECWSNGKKLAAIGWVAREGRDRSRRSVRVVLVEDEGGQARALKTTLLDREDISEHLNRQLGDKLRYYGVGFTASLDVAAADPAIRPGALHIAYDEAGTRVLLPIPCRVGAPQ
ncbi:hypothetical protein [Luteimonas mephitis]|uniref:hypothetical protein n=1 Tax=Luteimonas mephitis TaxID=83615 RepID=UPI00047AD270|nr:hypothetical protein [Luteimonas mephitis]